MSSSVASWPAFRFLKRQVRWSGIPMSFRIFQFIVIHTVKGFGIVNKAEIDVFLELSCFSDDPADVGTLISGSSVFSKTSLNNWKFTVHVLLKPGLENFEHYFTSVWDECSCVEAWAAYSHTSPHHHQWLESACMCVSTGSVSFVPLYFLKGLALVSAAWWVNPQRTVKNTCAKNYWRKNLVLGSVAT